MRDLGGGEAQETVSEVADGKRTEEAEEIAEELAGKVTIAKMDIMENQQIPGQIGVQSIPLMVLFKDGKQVAQKLGAAPKSQLKGWLESVL